MSDRRRRAQRGQAIVLVGLTMLVLLGFLGLAMDSGRAYLDRRGMQAGADAGALAAAYTCMNEVSSCMKNVAYIDAENNAISEFQINERLNMSPTCSGLGSASVSCTYADPTNLSLSIAVTNRSVAGRLFTVTATHHIQLAIMQILGAAPTISIGAIATADARLPDSGAAIQTLSPAGCGGNTHDSLVFQGTETAILNGDVWSNGDIKDQSSNPDAGTISGNVIDICPPIPPNNPVPNFTVGGAEANGTPLPDPGFALPTLKMTSQTWASNDYSVIRLPGVYSSNVGLTSSDQCWFLAGGTYDFANGFKQNGGFVSNELRPPDEPVYNNNSVRATYQFWDTNLSGYGLGPGSNKAQCSGEFMPYANGSDSSNPPINPTSYAVELTTVGWGPANCGPPAAPTCFLRESSPSMCKTVTLGSSQVLKIWVSNVAGARGYNVYLASNSSCSGPFGYVGQFVTTGTEQNKTLSGCNPSLAGLTSPPSLSSCDLGSSSATINGSNACIGVAPSSTAAQDTCGAPPPAGEGMPIGPGLPNADIGTGLFPQGDQANENYCVNSSGSQVACGPGDTVPGGVFFYIPGPGSNTQCLSLQGGGSDYLFTGYQFGRMLLFEPGSLDPPPANTCLNNVTGGNLTSLLGIFYLPEASITIAGQSSYAAVIAGGVIAWTANIQGNGGVSITADQSLRFPGAVQLVK